jgi:hypothetical protein
LYRGQHHNFGRRASLYRYSRRIENVGAGLAWVDRALRLGETHCCVRVPPSPTVSSARPLPMASTEAETFTQTTLLKSASRE